MSAPDTRTRILDVAQDLIQRRGVNGMSFQDISDAVGIRTPSIHHHFAGKQDLVEALLLRYRGEFDLRLADILASPLKAQTKLQRYAGLFEDTLQAGDHEKSCLCGMLAAELLSLGEGPARSVRGFLQDNVKQVAKILAEGRSDGSLDFRGSAEDAASMVLATLEGGLLIARAEGGPKRMAALVRQLLSLLTAR